MSPSHSAIALQTEVMNVKGRMNAVAHSLEGDSPASRSGRYVKRLDVRKHHDARRWSKKWTHFLGLDFVAVHGLIPRYTYEDATQIPNRLDKTVMSILNVINNVINLLTSSMVSSGASLLAVSSSLDRKSFTHPLLAGPWRRKRTEGAWGYQMKNFNGTCDRTLTLFISSAVQC